MTGASLSGGHAASSTSRYASSGPTRARYGDSTTTSGTPGHLALPLLPERLGVLRLVGDEDGPYVVGDRPGDVDGLDDGPVHAGDRDDDAFLAVRGLEDDVLADPQLAARGGRTGD